MNTGDYLRILKDDIHSAVFATVDEQGLPVARVIDVMLADEDSLYFITARGKAFYRQLEAVPFVAVSGMTGGEGSLNKKAVSVRGKVENTGNCLLGRVFEENPYMAEIYPTAESRRALEVFRLYEGDGEFFDLSVKPVVRHSFRLGAEQSGEMLEAGNYVITDACTGCGNCLETCPQNCITGGKLPFEIQGEHCLHCGNCLAACPAGAVKRC